MEDMLEIEQIDELTRLYFKKNKMDWDAFDKILMQLTMRAMHDQSTKELTQLQHYQDVRKEFMRRASRHEFPAIKLMVYLNFGMVIVEDAQLLEQLCRYGLDTLYPKLNWLDKITLVDVVSKLGLPWMDKVFQKVAIDVMRAPHGQFAYNLSIDHQIQTIGLFIRWSLTSKTHVVSIVELLNKFQLILLNTILHYED